MLSLPPVKSVFPPHQLWWGVFQWVIKMSNLRHHLLSSKIISEFITEAYLLGSNSQSEAITRLYVSDMLKKVRRTGPKMYKVYTIPKRNGGKRTIAHPSKMLKAVQRALVQFLEDKLPVHSSSYAYRYGVGIKDNAKKHMDNPYFLKMDLSNFFNSIDTDLFIKQLERYEISLRKADLDLICKGAFWSPTKSIYGRFILSVGAPSSPLISNFIMNEFDEIISSICKHLHVEYTRYADDLFFSTKIDGVLFKLPKIVEYVLSTTYDNKLMVNVLKTKFSSKAHNRHVTGITITNENTLSLGRSRKRMIASLIHRYILEQLDYDGKKRLQGLLSFAKHIEPLFVERLKIKYSSRIIDDIISNRWDI